MKRTNYLNIPLKKLISEYFSIEFHIRQKIEKSIFDSLNIIGFSLNGNIAKKDENIFSISTTFIKNNRTLLISFRSLKDRKKTKILEESVNHFGEIKNILFETDYSDKNLFIPILDVIKKELIREYLALASAFSININEIQTNVFRKIYAIFNNELTIQSKKELLDKYHFVIFHKNTGFYLFDALLTERIINYFIENQLEEVSPAQLTIWLMTNPLPFDKSLAKEVIAQDKILSSSWSSAKFWDEANQFWQAAGFYRNYEEYTSFPICSVRDYHLVMATKTKYENIFMPIHNDIREELKHQFEIGLKNYSVYFKLFNNLKSNIENPKIISLMGEFTAPIIKSLLKG